MVGGQFPTIEVDPRGELQKSLNEAASRAQNLTIPLTLISQSWFKSNRAIFKLSGPGKYADLSDKYKKFKTRHLGSAYPILRLTGALEASITDPTALGAVSYIVNKVSLALGTSVSWKGVCYPAVLHHGSQKRNMPARPVVLFGNEQVAPSELNARIEAWKKILGDYVAKVSKKNG